MSEPIHTIPDLVAKLGGPTAVAEWLGIEHPSAVSNWSERGYIPAGWHLRLFLEALRRGHRVDPALFGLTDAETRHVTMRFRRPRALKWRRGESSAVQL